MTRLLSALLLCACAPVSLPPPVHCVVDDLPPGVLAEADLETQTITIAPQWHDLPASVRVFVVVHEVCHLRGYVTESGADCCAADAMARVWGRAFVLDAALWLQGHGRDVYQLVECVP